MIVDIFTFSSSWPVSLPFSFVSEQFCPKAMVSGAAEQGELMLVGASQLGESEPRNSEEGILT